MCLNTGELLDVEADRGDDFGGPAVVRFEVVDHRGLAAVVEADDEHVDLSSVQPQHGHQLGQQAHLSARLRMRRKNTRRPSAATRHHAHTCRERVAWRPPSKQSHGQGALGPT